MRVLFASTRGAGHIGPMIPFAHACRAAGHDILFAAAASSRAHVERAGLPFHALADPSEEVLAPIWARVRAVTPAEADRLVTEEVFAGEHARSALPGMLALMRRWRPDVVLRETCEFASLLAAEAAGIPDVHTGVFLSIPQHINWDLQRPLSRLAADFGLPPLYLDRSDQPYLTLAPRSLENPAWPSLPGTHRFRAPAPLEAPPPDWWRGSEDPLVYVSFGSAAAGNGFFPDLYRDAAEALGEERVRVLLTLGLEVDPAELGPVPGNVHVEPWVPQGAVMAHAEAMVGHGGSGSTLAAMAAGLPLAVVPLFADQPENARRVAALGAGVALDGVAGLRDAVRALLTEPSYARAARAVAGEIAAYPPVDEVAALLEEIVRGEALAAA